MAFRREKCVEFGGPAGGNGGRGGNVWAVVDDSLNSLSAFRTQVGIPVCPCLSKWLGRCCSLCRDGSVNI